MLQPIKFKPVFKERIWGSDRLKLFFGKELPLGVKIGESWELSDLPGGQSTVAEGEWAGMKLRELLEAHGPIIGFTEKQCEEPFGLLIKFLDANDILSVQVHPDARACRELPGAQLKTECWYVMDAAKDAVIYCGLKENVEAVGVRKALADGGIEKLMRRYPARKGDFYYLPAGTIHALGAGVMVAEIQTPSDTTYRLYDWKRRDAQGKLRELHVAEAMKSINFTDSTYTPPTVTYEDKNSVLMQTGTEMGWATHLLSCPYFNVIKVQTGTGSDRRFAVKQPTVMLVLGGKGHIGNAKDSGKGIGYQAGDTILIPQLEAVRFQSAEAGEILLTDLGPEKVR